MGRTVNRMSRAGSVALRSWYVRNKTYRLMSAVQVASCATKELGFKVTPANIVGVRRVERTTPTSSPSLRMFERVDVVCRAVADLYQSLGEPVPEGLL